MKKQILAALSIISVCIIAGCGSSGSGTSNSATTSIAGKVADGYLVNAQVFMDKNSNYILDAGEPVTVTDSAGAYTLNVSPDDIGKYHILALAIAGQTIDLDNPAQPLQSTYLLCLPKDIVSGTVTNFISPISTQLREMMETGNYASIQVAMEELRTKIGLPIGTNMREDYIKTNNPEMHNMARNLATIMGGHASQVIGTGHNVEVNRYRAMMGTIFSNISSIRGNNHEMNVEAISNAMTEALGTIPPMTQGQPFNNMSSTFRGRFNGFMNSMMGR